MNEISVHVRQITEKEPSAPRKYESDLVVFPCPPQVGWCVTIRSMEMSVYNTAKYREMTLAEKWEVGDYRIFRIGTSTSGIYEGALWIDLEEVA